MIDGKQYRPYSVVKREDNACTTQNYLEQVYLREKLGTQYYMFDFKKYRRGSQDILDLERTGQISEEEAIYQHIRRYSSNAWYYFRFGLQDYFQQYRIPIPQVLMLNPITNALFVGYVIRPWIFLPRS